MRPRAVRLSLRLLLLVVAGVAGFWALRHGSEEEPPELGLWRLSDRALSAREFTDDQRRRIEQLEAIGYVEGSELPTTDRIVTVHDLERAWGGFNFYTSGHGGEAFLLDMDGNVLHTWRAEFDDLWPDRKHLPRKNYWRRAALFPNGDVVALYAGRGIVKVDKDSNVLWKVGYGAHHDLQVMPNGDIYTLARKARVIPEIHPEEPVLEDFIIVLDQEGEIVKFVSVLEALLRSDFAHLWPEEERNAAGDVFHTNSIEVLDGRFAHRIHWLRRGNVLTSMRRLHTIVVIDMDLEVVVQMWKGDFKAQHDPRILENGNLLLFDNQGREGPSSVIEFELPSREPVWAYRGTPEAPFHSQFCGAAARLPNGNTLITESGHGRAFEVTPEKEIVWEFHNPARAGEDEQFVASLLELVRLPPDFPLDWLPD